ncbi:MAG: CBS domain-containing protein [Caldilineaceae bacterium]|nr:CBS domain-containing protein [Caldilineaceae bacterium]
MQVREIMSSPAITVSPTTNIRDVARTMRENIISGVPVVDDNDTLLGVITEMDLIARNAPVHEPRYIAVLSALIPVSIEEYRQYKEQLRQALAINAVDLMQDEAETIGPDALVEEALEAMLNPEVTMLPVLEQGRVIGVVTRTDLVRLIEKLEAAPDEPPAQ